jgi:uncharacterized protein YukE
MKSELESMFNQIRRIWADKGAGDKDFTPQEQKLKEALEHLQQASENLSRASEALLNVINAKGN